MGHRNEVVDDAREERLGVCLVGLDERGEGGAYGLRDGGRGRQLEGGDIAGCWVDVEVRESAYGWDKPALQFLGGTVGIK